MEKKVKKILKEVFDKYNVPKEAIEGATMRLVQLLSNPLHHKTGATVMTPEASLAGDPGAKNKKAKPEVL